MSLIENIKKQIKNQTIKPIIAFAEGWNPIIQQAAITLKEEGLIEPWLIFRTNQEVNVNNKLNHVHKIIIENENLTTLANELYLLRKDKGLTLQEAQILIKQPNYLTNMLIKCNQAHGAICGIEYTTKDTLRPALQIIKTAKETNIVNSVLVLEKDEETLYFADVSLVINPTPLELAQMTENVLDFVENQLEIKDTRTALLSYSTNGSGKGESVEKVAQAYQIFKQRNRFPNAKVFGEIQFDAAYVDEVRNKKAPHLDWSKPANIFMFPNIDAGNICCKMMERCGGYKSSGAIIIGLDKPVNDLSRGATLYEVTALSYITAIQAIKKINKTN